MRVRDWEDIVQDVVDADSESADWRAVAGDRQAGIGEDLYLGHPTEGLFQLKTFAKNPYEVQGIGTQIARSLDEEIGSYLPAESNGRFAVQSPPEDKSDAEKKAEKLETVLDTHSDAPTEPGDMFDDVMDVLESPAFGPMEYDQFDRPDGLDELNTTFSEAEDVLEGEFDDLLEESDVSTGFH